MCAAVNYIGEAFSKLLFVHSFTHLFIYSFIDSLITCVAHTVTKNLHAIASNKLHDATHLQ